MTLTRLLRRLLNGFAVLAVLGVLGDRGIVRVPLAGAPVRGHAPDADGILRGRPHDPGLDRPRGTGHAGADSGNEARAPRLDLVPVGGRAISRRWTTTFRLDCGRRPRPPAVRTSGRFSRETRRRSAGTALRDPDVSPQQRSYPVVIMRAGASAPVLNYSTLAEDLASHGYVVVGFDAPYRTGRVVFPDGRVMGRTEQNNPETCVVPDRARMERCVSRVMTAWTGDIAFVLDRLARLNASDSSGKFTGRLDMTRVGVFGHSLGGAVAAQFCHEDSRCKAGIDIDGAPHGSVIQAGLHQPFMFLLSDHGDASDSASVQIRSDIQSIYDRIPPDRRLRVAIRGAFHFTFSDDGALLKSSVVRGVLRAVREARYRRGRRQLAVTAYCVHTFFDTYLKGAGEFAVEHRISALSGDPGSRMKSSRRAGGAVPRRSCTCVVGIVFGLLAGRAASQQGRRRVAMGRLGRERHRLRSAHPVRTGPAGQFATGHRVTRIVGAPASEPSVSRSRRTFMR